MGAPSRGPHVFSFGEGAAPRWPAAGAWPATWPVALGAASEAGSPLSPLPVRLRAEAHPATAGAIVTTTKKLLPGGAREGVQSQPRATRHPGAVTRLAWSGAGRPTGGNSPPRATGSAPTGKSCTVLLPRAIVTVGPWFPVLCRTRLVCVGSHPGVLPSLF